MLKTKVMMLMTKEVRAKASEPAILTFYLSKFFETPASRPKGFKKNSES